MGGPTEKFSRRERAAEHFQKPNDLAREAVGWNGLFGAPASVVRVPIAYADHTGTGSRLPRQAFGWDHAHLGSHVAQRASI
jgi:hypothetical protein